ncbi:hypothetical protein EV1_023911 [Malus domestica]
MIETKNQALFDGYLVEPELADDYFEWAGLVSWCMQLMRAVKRPILVSLPQTCCCPPCFLRIYIYTCFWPEILQYCCKITELVSTSSTSLPSLWAPTYTTNQSPSSSPTTPPTEYTTSYDLSPTIPS